VHELNRDESSVHMRCGARFGFWVANWPFSRFEVAHDFLEVKLFPFTRIRIPRHEVACIRMLPSTFLNCEGLEIESTRLDRRLVVLIPWSEKVLGPLRRHGYRIARSDDDRE
jgi:hypothetical protein